VSAQIFRQRTVSGDETVSGHATPRDCLCGALTGNDVACVELGFWLLFEIAQE